MSSTEIVSTTPPTSFSPTRPENIRRHSSGSTYMIPRKPIPYVAEEELPLPQTSTLSDNPIVPVDPAAATAPFSPSTMVLVKPPAYVLSAIVPSQDLIPNRNTSTPPPTYSYPPSSPSSSSSSISPSASLPLPAYNQTPKTEPHTLPRTLFFWGFLFPFLWILGSVILCLPLKVYEEDFEADWAMRNEAGSNGLGLRSGEEEGKKERERIVLNEKVEIMRKAELRWAKYCTIALGGFISLVVLVIIVALLVIRSKK